MLGYLAGVAVATVSLRVGQAVFGDNQFLSRYMVGFSVVVMSITIFLAWIAAAVPVFVLRWLIGYRGLATASRSMGWGAVAAFVSAPFTIEMRRLCDFEGVSGPFVPDFLKTFVPTCPLDAAAGALGGLVYWLIEFSALPEVLWNTLRDRRKARWTGGLFSNRAAAALSMLALTLVVVPTARWWWTPHLVWSSGVGLPRLALEQDQSAKGIPIGLAWSQGARIWVSKDVNDDGLTIFNSTNDMTSQLRLANLALPKAGFVQNGRELVFTGGLTTSSPIAFSVIDLATGKTVFSENDPAPGQRGQVGAAVQLSFSLDESAVAVSYQFPRPGQPISPYDTKDWHKISTLTVLNDSQASVGPVTFSSRASLIAFGLGEEVIIMNTKTGKPLRRIAVSANTLAISPDATMVAVATNRSFIERQGTDIRIFRLADGVELALHAGAKIGSNHIVWDPRQRFITFIGNDDAVHLWNPLGPIHDERLIEVRPAVSFIAFSSDATRLAIGNGNSLSVFKIL